MSSAEAARQRGFVVGLRWTAAAGFFADFFAALALVPVVARFFVVRLCVDAAVLPLVAVAPDDTRVECLGRCLTFFAAASAGSAAAKAARSTTSSTLIALRIITRSSVAGTILHDDSFVMAFFLDRHAAVRDAIYAGVVEHGAAPAPADVAQETGFETSDVAEIYRALADAHVIVLHPGTLSVAWAPPFSTVPTAFRTEVDGASWFAPCAWDAFGIPAALKRDASIHARCAWSGDALPCGVRDGRAFGEALIHLLVPAAHFWDDIFFT
jgi:hypothetical protein